MPMRWRARKQGGEYGEIDQRVGDKQQRVNGGVRGKNGGHGGRNLGHSGKTPASGPESVALLYLSTMIRLMEPKIGGENPGRTPTLTGQFAGQVTGQITSQVEAEQSYFCLCYFTFSCTRRGAIKNAAGARLKFRHRNCLFRRRDLSRACRPARREALALAQPARPSE
jgi:hypothetical protein